MAAASGCGAPRWRRIEVVPMDISDIVVGDHDVIRYRQNYGLGPEINAHHVEKHLRLEFELTKRLLASTRETRWETFSDCYTTLYKELPWLNKTDDELDGMVGHDLVPWRSLLGSKARIFEVGSGQARLLKYLTSIGHSCVATEITSERGSKHLEEGDGLVWRITDGVNLAKFEKTQSNDFIISSQVVEHLHPDDLIEHFENSRMILKPGGEYIFDTPHRGAGPHDLSLVFGLDRAVFMHLREYNFLELRAALRAAGFKQIRAIFMNYRLKPHRSVFYLEYCILWDRVLTALRLHPRTERRVRSSWKVRSKLHLPSNIWLSAKA
jgi:SAM-dependent methyltransferase